MSCRPDRSIVRGTLLLGAAAWLAAAAGVGPWAGTTSWAREAGRPPNVLLIMADDVGREVLCCYGGSSYETPQLDRLCRTGTRFDHCYSMPVCHPTRIALMTGRYPFRFGAGWGSFPNDVRTIGHVLRDAGYATAVAGKWQLVLMKRNTDHARELGFDRSALFGWHEGPRYHDPMIYRNGEVWTEVRKPDVYGPEVYTDFLIDFMGQNRDRPFFAYYSMALCHEISDDFSPVPPPGPDGKYVSYSGMVADMDRMVGKLVATLQKLGLRERTVVIFTTDNGSPGRYLTDVTHEGGKPRRHHAPVISKMDGREIRGGKGSLSDWGTRVPLIVNWPGTTPAGRTVYDLVDFTDFLPTLAELAGAEVPEEMKLDGRSFAPQIKGLAGDPRPWAFSESGGKYWIRTQRWKLTHDGKLFDTEADPEEKHPIAPSQAPPEAAAAREQLQSALKSLGRVGD